MEYTGNTPIGINAMVEHYPDLARDVNRLDSDVKNVYDIEPVELVTVNGLNFVSNATNYTGNSNYKTKYFRIETGFVYHIICKNTNSGTGYYRHVLSDSIPSDGVAGTMLRQDACDQNLSAQTDYTATQSGFFGIAAHNYYIDGVKVTAEKGIVVDRFRNEAFSEPRFLCADDFEQGSLYQRNLYCNNFECIALKGFQACGEGVDRIVFEDLDPERNWKVRFVFFDENTDYITQVGYDFLDGCPIPSGAKYFRFAISPYELDGTAITNVAPEDVTPGTIRISLLTSEQTIKEFTDSEYDQIEETGYGYLHADFVNGSLVDGNVVHTNVTNSRITSEKKFRFSRDITLIPDEGYKFGIHSFGTTGEEFVSDSGWNTAPYTVPAGTYFRVVIAEVTTSISVLDVLTAQKAVKVTTLFTDLNKPIIKGNELSFRIGSLYSGLDYEISSRICSQYVKVRAGTVIEYTGDADCMDYSWYDKNLVFDSSKSHEWSAGNIGTVAEDGYIRILLKKASGNISDSEIEGLVSQLTIRDPHPVRGEDIWNTIAEIRDELIEGRRHVYYGEKIPTGHSIWYEPYWNIQKQPTAEGTTRQGATIYGRYLFLAYNKNPMISVYDFPEKKHLANMVFTAVDTYHCNNINFGTQKYDPDDAFPLLYVSMENIAEHKCLVYRIQESSGSWTATLVQTITYPDPATVGAYYPNCILDNDNGVMYITSYTTNSYWASAGNNLRICKYTIPLLSQGDVTLNYADKLDEFLLPSMTATQGAYVFKGKIIEVFGFTGSAFLAQIDPEQKKVVTKISLDDIGLAEEPESVFMYNGDVYVYQVFGNVYRMHFS